MGCLALAGNMGGHGCGATLGGVWNGSRPNFLGRDAIVDVKLFVGNLWSAIQKYRISIERERWRLTVLLAMPAAVELLQ
jgi:hypothetical protein